MSELREEIRLLENKRETQLELIKEDFSMVVESLRPSNIIKSSVSNIVSSPRAFRNILMAVGGIAVAYITRKKLVRTNQNPVRKILITIIQAGVASLLSVKAQDIKEKLYALFKGIILSRKQEQYQ